MVNGYTPKTLAEALAFRSQRNLVPYAGGTAPNMVPDHCYAEVGGQVYTEKGRSAHGSTPKYAFISTSVTR